MSASIDRAALLGWLRTHANHPRPVIHAVLTGLAERIERGDFDTTKAAPGSARTLNPGPDQHLVRGAAMHIILSDPADNPTPSNGGNR